MEEPVKKQLDWKTIGITALIVLIVVQAINLFFFVHTGNKYNAEIETARDSIAVMQNELQQRADEIKKLGGNISDLDSAIRQLEEDKKALVERGKITTKQMTALRDKVEGYRELLVMKDQEIDRLKKMNDQLLTENTNLKTTTNELNAALSQEKQTSQQLQSKVEVAQRLKAENIKVLAVNSHGKVKDSNFKSRFIDKIRVEFNIADNPIAPIEGKDIMIRIIGPNDNVLFDVEKGGGTIMLNGKEEFFTLKQHILFDNSQQQLAYDYTKGSEFEPGRYVVKVYTDDYEMGEQAFLIK